MFRTLLRRRQLAAPTGAPLYTYCVTDSEFLDLGVFIAEHLEEGGALGGVGAAFCMFGAEAFARSEGDDWWTYQPLYRALGYREDQLAYEDVRSAIETGMRAWRRPLLGNASRTEYLGTLVSEGGLPTDALKNHGGRIREYFAELLRRHELDPPAELLVLAKACGTEALPTRLNNVIVWDLATKVVAEVARMRIEKAALGSMDLSKLPLRLTSVAAQELLSTLYTQRSVAPSRDESVKIITRLDLSTNPVQLRRTVEIPSRLSVEYLRRIASLPPTEPPQRLYLRITLSDGSQQPAGTATLRDGAYHVRPEAMRPITNPSRTTGQVRCEVATADGSIGSFVPVGGDSLDDDVWVFADSTSPALLAQGPCKVAGHTALCVAPADVSFDGEHEIVAELPTYGRRIVKALGPLVADRGFELQTARTGNPDELELQGILLSSIAQNADVWRGAPQLLRRFRDGTTRSLAATTSWKVVGMPERYGSAPPGPGVFTVTAEGDGCRYRRKLRCVPRDFQIRVAAASRQHGELVVVGTGISEVSVDDWAHTAVHRGADASFRVRVERGNEKTVPTEFTLRLRGQGGGELTLTVPFPVAVAAFVGDHKTLGAGESVSLDELSHLRVRIVAPRRAKWTLTVGDRCVAEFNTDVLDAPMAPYREALLIALAQEEGLDFEVPVELSRLGGGVSDSARCKVRRYDLYVSPVETDRGTREIVLDDQKAEGTVPAYIDSLRAEAVSLFALRASPVPLEQVHPGRWRFDDPRFSTGTWLVLVYQGTYLRGRPLRMFLGAPAADEAQAAGAGAMRTAMWEGDKHPRRAAIRTAFAQLSDRIADDDWSLLLEQMSAVGKVPAATFDCVRIAIEFPHVLVVALMASFEPCVFWASMEELPFLWEAVPVSAWMRGLAIWGKAFDSVGGHLASDSFLRVFDALDGESPAIAVLRDAAAQVLANFPRSAAPHVASCASAEMRAARAAIVVEDRRALVARHAEGTWPAHWPWVAEGAPDSVSGLPLDCLVTVQAPIRLAREVARGVPKANLYRLRIIRDFDPQWFDDSFHAHLAIELGACLQLKEGPFSE